MLCDDGDDLDCPPCIPCPGDRSLQGVLIAALVGAIGAAIAEELIPSLASGTRRLIAALRSPPQPLPRVKRKKSRKKPHGS